MIHVAPCSCELHVRIRELEWKARAEKAESLVDDAKKILANLRSQILILISQKQRSEARVAELEPLAEHAHLIRGRCDTCGKMARERVGDETPSQGVHEREEC